MRKTIHILMMILISFGPAACTTNQPSTVEHGSSVRMALASQTLNPEPASDAPVTGLDGDYAATVSRDFKAGEYSKKKGGGMSGMFLLGGEQEGAQ